MRKFILLFALMSFLMTGCATPNETNVNTNTVPLTVQNDDKGVPPSGWQFMSQEQWFQPIKKIIL